MRVIVSNELKDTFSSFVVVESMKRAHELSGVDLIVIHKCKESDFDAGSIIQSMYQAGMKQFVYICAPEEQSMMIKTVLTGINGCCFDDEFYLEDEEELNALIDSLDFDNNTQLAVIGPPIQVITSFIDAFTKGDDRIKAPLYLESVKGAITELTEIAHKQELSLLAMGNSAIEIFERANSVIDTLRLQRKDILEKVKALEDDMAQKSQPKPMYSNNVLFFPPYSYTGSARVLVIREYSPCRYLTSFVLGYVHYLHYQMNLKTKLIFAVQKGVGISAKYDRFTMITQENMARGDLFDNDIVVTNNPKKEVMQRLFSYPYDVFIVVDRLYGNSDIVSGRTFRVNALSSWSDVERYHVKPEDSIFSVISQPKQLFFLPTFKDFPLEIDARYSAYARATMHAYEILNGRMKIKEGE